MHSLNVYKALTGEQVWQSPTFANGVSPFTMNQDNVYFGTTLTPQKQPITGRIYAYNIRSNKQLWSTPVDGAIDRSPVFVNGVIYAIVDGDAGDNSSPSHAQIVAIDATTGTIKWQQTLDENYIGAVGMDDGAIIASAYNLTSQHTPTSQKMYVLQKSNGNILSEDTQHVFDIIVPAK